MTAIGLDHRQAKDIIKKLENKITVQQESIENHQIQIDELKRLINVINCK